ncbi:MAG: helix-turn-helix domain-containing protein [Candidatus Cloacimonetes bacterium]|nr:helix-turn-helix domain-containing protein [Candidatus Cloacimonadota bacterium]
MPIEDTNDNSIGKYLKETRIQRELTLEEISEKTKIKTRFLTAIEDNDFDNLGGRGYARATIITYARAIGADVNKVLKDFDELYRPISEKFHYSSSYQPKKYLISTNLLSFLFFLILILVIIFLSIKFYKEGKFKSPFQKSTPTPMETKEKPESVKTVLPELEQEVIEPDNTSDNFDQRALDDTTDYLDELLFSAGESPLDYDQ